MSKTVTWSKTVTFFEGDWHDGNVPIMGPRTHAAWLCTSVFDGARAFEGVTPDLDLHCARINESVKAMYLNPVVPTETWIALVREGLKRFDRDAELYIRPMYWAEDAAGGVRYHGVPLVEGDAVEGDALVPHRPQHHLRVERFQLPGALESAVFVQAGPLEDEPGDPLVPGDLDRPEPEPDGERPRVPVLRDARLPVRWGGRGGGGTWGGGGAWGGEGQRGAWGGGDG